MKISENVVGTRGTFRGELKLLIHRNLLRNQFRRAIPCLEMVLLIVLLVSFQHASSAVLMREDFSDNVFVLGDWIQSNTSVYVNETEGWLHFAAVSPVSDYADKAINFTLPIVIESRMRLVSFGSSYRLPTLGLFYGSGLDSVGFVTYLSGPGWGWKLMNTWTDVHTAGPDSENVWCTIQVIVESTGGELYAKSDGESGFTYLTSQTWTIPNQLTKLRFAQPWEAICDVDYVEIRESDPSASPDTLFVGRSVDTEISRNSMSVYLNNNDSIRAGEYPITISLGFRPRLNKLCLHSPSRYGISHRYS